MSQDEAAERAHAWTRTSTETHRRRPITGTSMGSKRFKHFKLRDPFRGSTAGTGSSDERVLAPHPGGSIHFFGDAAQRVE